MSEEEARAETLENVRELTEILTETLKILKGEN